MSLSSCRLHLTATGRSRWMHSRDCARVRFGDLSDLDQLLEPAKVVGELGFGDGSKDFRDLRSEWPTFRLDLGNELDFRAIAGYGPESNGAGVMDLTAVEGSPFDYFVGNVIDHGRIPL